MKERGSVDSQMARESGGMTPLDHLGSDAGRNVEFAVRTFARCSPGSQGGLDHLLDFHLYGADEDLGAEDGVRFGFSEGTFEVEGQCIGYNVLSTRSVG